MRNVNEKNGLAAFGFLTNFQTYLDELNGLIADEKSKVDYRTLNTQFDEAVANGKIKYLNKFGFPAERSGIPIKKEQASYAIYQTEFKKSDGKAIIGWFSRTRLDTNFSGISFGTESELKEQIKDSNLFRIGDLVFDEWSDGFDFLEDLSKTTIPEKWTYQNHKSKIPHPILKAYVENIFEKLQKETGKILKSDDGKFVIFNSSLLDKYFHEIFIISETEESEGEVIYKNPFRMKSFSDLAKLGFKIGGQKIQNNNQLPAKATFFKDINEVIFKSKYTIDRSFEKFEHIIDERKDRFPPEHQTKSTDELARLLDSAINYAVAISERNYKFIVPHYRPQDDKIQLLMPIYLSGSFSDKPDFALVLDLIDEFYVPQTILPLDAAYQNARLIAKPDEYWLNPDKI